MIRFGFPGFGPRGGFWPPGGVPGPLTKPPNLQGVAGQPPDPQDPSGDNLPARKLCRANPTTPTLSAGQENYKNQ